MLGPVTSYARSNLIKNIMKLDDYLVYADTDSVKVAEGYDKEVIENYNKFVVNKINHVSKLLEIPLNKFAPKDKNGITRMLGLFDEDGHYLEFKTLGAKKYAYKSLDKNKDTGELEEKVHITVSGVPKKGAKALKGDLNNFKDSLIFKYEDTGKNILFYTEGQRPIVLTDIYGEDVEVYDKSGCCIVPNTYTLGTSEEYARLLNDSSKRAHYKIV